MWDMTFYVQNYHNCERNVNMAYDVEKVYSPVLAARSTMQVNNKFEVVVRCPGDGIF